MMERQNTIVRTLQGRNRFFRPTSFIKHSFGRPFPLRLPVLRSRPPNRHRSRAKQDGMEEEVPEKCLQLLFLPVHFLLLPTQVGRPSLPPPPPLPPPKAKHSPGTGDEWRMASRRTEEEEEEERKNFLSRKKEGGLLTASTAMGEGKKKHEEEKERGRGKGDKKVAVERAGKKGRRGRKKLKCLCQPRGKEKKGRHRLWEREKGEWSGEKVVLQRSSFPLPFFRLSIRLPPLPSSLFQHRHFPATDLLHDRPPPPPPPVISSVVGRLRWRWQQERDSDSSSLRRLRRHLRGWKLLMLSSGDWSRRGEKSKRERGSKIISREDLCYTDGVDWKREGHFLAVFSQLSAVRVTQIFA